MPATVAILLGVAVIGLATDRNSVTVNELRVVPPVVKPGGMAYAVFSITDFSHGRCNDGVVHRWIIDGRGVLFTLESVGVVQTTAAQVAENAKGDNGHTFAVRVNFPVPRGISDGAATYHARTERWCNILQRMFPISGQYQSPFTVDSVNGLLYPEPESGLSEVPVPAETPLPTNPPKH